MQRNMIAKNKEDALGFLPSYARNKEDKFPQWKINFIRKNREFYARHKTLRKMFQSIMNSYIDFIIFVLSLRLVERNASIITSSMLTGLREGLVVAFAVILYDI